MGRRNGIDVPFFSYRFRGGIMEITSVNNKIIKEMTKLHQKKYRDKEGLFLVEGYHLYEESKKFGHIHSVYTIDKKITGDNVYYVSKQVLQKLSQIESPQGVVTVCYKVNKTEVTSRVLLLDHVQDPGNLGTLLRSALAFGFKTIVLDGCVDLYNTKVLRSTQGALYQLNIIFKNSVTFVEENKEHIIIGTSLNGTPLKEYHLNHNQKVIVILGNEGSGVKKELLQKTDVNITIKTTDVDSLNVGVAGSILMHEFSVNE